MKTFKIAISGSRTITSKKIIDIIHKTLHRIQLEEDVEVNRFQNVHFILGGARGVDKVVEKYCVKNNITHTVFEAEWDLYGKRAGYIRNKVMADHSNYLISFWDGESRGTKAMIDLCKNTHRCFNYKKKEK